MEIRSPRSGARPRHGFTLVELLVVITIIGILVSLLLPAVQSAREAARSLQCKNNLKQVSLAALQHNTTHGHFPSCGWGWRWMGDPDAGVGRKQPGGWIFNILPFMEQSNIHDLGLGLTDAAAKRAALTDMTTRQISTLYCPSRRSGLFFQDSWTFRNIDNAGKVARNDYAINAGDQEAFSYGTSPMTIPEGADPTFVIPAQFTRHTGVSYGFSEVSSAAIRDGVSNTYLIGEKSINPDMYDNGGSEGDNSNPYEGYDWDIVRWGSDGTDAINGTATQFLLPGRDQAGTNLLKNFGSIHSGGFNMSLCDGSVRNISYSIDGTTHARLSNRKDGQTTQLP